jgi:uncharacterized protein (DUF2141 family)
VLLLAGAALASTAASPPPTAELDVSISGLRNTRGAVMLCLTRRGAGQFLDCAHDPARITRIVPSAATDHIVLTGAQPGYYALLVIHDENRNGRLDKMLGLPREGFGFSRNPGLRMGPPHYDDVRFVLAGHERQTVKINYLL